MRPQFELFIQSCFLHLSHPEVLPALSKPVMVLYYLPNNTAADYEFIKEVRKTKQPLY